MDKEEDVFKWFLLIISLLYGINIIAWIWSTYQVGIILTHRNDSIGYFSGAVGTLFMNSIASLGVGVVSLIIPKVNFMKVYNKLESAKYRICCLVMGIGLQVFALWTGLSPWKEYFELIKQGILQ